MTTRHPLTAQHLRAIMLAVLGFSCWSVGDTFNKLLSASGVPMAQMITLGGFSGMLTILLATAARGNLKQLRPKKVSRLLLLGTTMPLNYGIILIALRHLPLAHFYAISFASPLCVAVLAAWLFREKLDTRKILSIIAGFIGVLIAIDARTFFSPENINAGVIAALVAMVVFSGQSLYMRHLGKKEAQECVAFYPRLMTITTGVIGVAVTGWAPMQPHVIFYSLMGGGIGGLGWLAIASAYKHAPASTVAPFHYSQILVGAVLGYFVWGDVPAPHVIVGIVIIVTSGLYILLHARKSSATLKEPIA